MEHKEKSFRLSFKGGIAEYIAGGILFQIIGGMLLKPPVSFLYILGIVLVIFGLYYFLKGLYFGIKKILSYFKK